MFGTHISLYRSLFCEIWLYSKAKVEYIINNTWCCRDAFRKIQRCCVRCTGNSFWLVPDSKGLEFKLFMVVI